MASFSTECIIIKHSNFGESDRILTILTPFRGKIKVVAKGVRKITSRRSGNVEPLNRTKLHLFEGKGMPILTEAETLNSFPKIKSELILSAYGSHIVELIDRLVPEEQGGGAVYKLLLTILTLLQASPRQLFIRAYEVKLLVLLGFWSEDQIQTGQEFTALLAQLRTLEWTAIGELKINETQANELERILKAYLEKVLESPLRSMQVLEKLKQ